MEGMLVKGRQYHLLQLEAEPVLRIRRTLENSLVFASTSIDYLTFSKRSQVTIRQAF